MGLLLVGKFNLISVYFFVLFVGIGIDFSIQYSVRYRAERHDIPNLREAIRAAGYYVAAPLTLAGFATALGFFSFLPTNYKGVSELGAIAGCGMLIAYLTSVTVLPALIDLLNPAGEPEPLGYTALAPLDHFLDRNRLTVLWGVVATVVILLPSLYWLRFDFNPLNLRNPHTEAHGDLSRSRRSDPATNLNALEVLAPNLEAADAVAAKVAEAARSVAGDDAVVLHPRRSGQAPACNRRDREGDARRFRSRQRPGGAVGQGQCRGAERGRLATERRRQGQSGRRRRRPRRRSPTALTGLAKAEPKLRDAATEVFVAPLKRDLAALKASLAGPAGDARKPARRSRPRLDDRRTAARAFRSRRAPIPTTTTPCASSPRRCSPSSPTPPRGR